MANEQNAETGASKVTVVYTKDSLLAKLREMLEYHERTLEDQVAEGSRPSRSPSAARALATVQTLDLVIRMLEDMRLIDGSTDA